MPAAADELSESTLRQACAELDRGLRAGERCRAERLFADRPLLAACEDAALELIYTEFVAREDLGQRPTPEEYYARFPTWQGRLRRQFQVHRLFRDNLTSDTVGGTADDRDDSAPQRLGGHQLLEEVARGGGGVVYRARQQGLDRVVALKVLRPELGRKARARRRFFREAKVLAALRHRHVVAVHDLGEQAGWIWYSMDFAEGGSLARLALPLPPRRAAGLVQVVAEAVQHAHDCGVIHTDLKPSNVLLDREGQPLLSDFGLAWVGCEGGEERRRAFAGTPAYMAPEQFDPDGDIGPATDVWALGVILYELLAGRRPFTAATLDELQRAVCQEEPPSPAGPAALEAVWRRCLVKDPAGRFASAAELAAALAPLTEPG